jgi:tetratricopeptide (TPR) repeat protein
MRTYYEKVRGQSTGELLRTAREMYDSKKYGQVVEYLRPIMMVYPDDREFMKIRGLALLRLGESRGGSDELLSATDGEVMPEKILEETVQALFENRQYSRIIALFKTHHPGDNPNLLYHYGMSLFHTGNYTGAVSQLRKAIDEGRTDRETLHSLALAYDKTGNTRLALPLLERAFEMNETDRDVARSLAAAYRKLGRYEEAARILRKTQ